MTSTVVALIIVAINIAIGVIAKRKKEAERKMREEASVDVRARQTRAAQEAPAESNDFGPDLGKAIGDRIEEMFASAAGARPSEQLSGASPITTPRPTPRPTRPSPVRQPIAARPMQLGRQQPMTSRTAPPPLPTVARSPIRVPSRPQVQPLRPNRNESRNENRNVSQTVRPEANESSFAARRSERSAASEMDARKRARQVEHGRRRAERNAGKVARQALARARQARSVSARATRMRPIHQAKVSPLVSAIRAVFAKPESARTAFVVGEILSQSVGAQSVGASR